MPDNEILLFPNENEWEQVIQKRNLADSSPAVYAIVSDVSFGRLVGTSNVLYIGKATCLGGDGDNTRLYGYRYQPSNSRDGRIRELAMRAAEHGHNLKLKWLVMDSAESAATKETELLRGFMRLHLEVPPFNSKVT
ncbi:hypothetical protein [Microbulbifer sp. PAAF003]|uniref:hypothetical protein n=1 Tax=Microbulbifer sp. PAAF003 TaxID=3243375 RepID=UPI00403A2D56